MGKPGLQVQITLLNLRPHPCCSSRTAEFRQVPCGYRRMRVCFPSPTLLTFGFRFWYPMRTTDSSPMNTYGSCHSMPILGSDFLCYNHLLVDVAGSRLLDSSSLESIPAISSNSSNYSSDLYTSRTSRRLISRSFVWEGSPKMSIYGLSPV